MTGTKTLDARIGDPEPAHRRIPGAQLIPVSSGFPVMNSVRRSWKWLLPLAVACALFLRARLTPVPVLSHTAVRGTLVSEVLGTGTLEARVKTTLGPRLQERLAEVLVDQGDAVTNGQLLARLDDGELRRQVAVAEATLAGARATVDRVRTDQARAEAVLRQARLDHQRVADLLATRVTAQSEFDKAAESLNVAEADLRRTHAAIAEAQSLVVTAEKSLLHQQERLTFTELRSPFDGLVVRRDRDAGGVVVPGTSVLQIVATNEIWISAWVDETSAGILRTGQPARVVFRSDPDRPHTGTLARLGRETDRETREFLVDIRLESLPPHWTLGQRAEVYFETESRSNVMTIPESFLVRQEGVTGVFLENAGRALWQPVTPGMRGRGGVEVPEGVAEGTRVVRPHDGQSAPLKDGQRIALR